MLHDNDSVIAMFEGTHVVLVPLMLRTRNIIVVDVKVAQSCQKPPTVRQFLTKFSFAQKKMALGHVL